MAQETTRDTRCEVCGAEFPSSELLADHRDGRHGNSCPMCGADFTTEALLANHQLAHAAPDNAAGLSEKQGQLKP